MIKKLVALSSDIILFRYFLARHLFVTEAKPPVLSSNNQRLMVKKSEEKGLFREEKYLLLAYQNEDCAGKKLDDLFLIYFPLQYAMMIPYSNLYSPGLT